MFARPPGIGVTAGHTARSWEAAMRFQSFRVRRLLFAVAAVAIMVEVSGVAPRFRSYYRRSHEEQRQTSEYLVASLKFKEIAERLRVQLAQAEAAEAQTSLQKEIEDAEYQAEAFRQLAEWSDRKSQMYRTAKATPWSAPPAEPAFVHRHAATTTPPPAPANPGPGAAPSEGLKKGPSRIY